MTYIILEMQTSGGVTAVVTPSTYVNRNTAEQAFHLAASAAAVSAVEEHTVALLTSDGKLVRPVECYHHPVSEE